MEFLNLMADPQIIIAFLTLTILEIVLGIDNIIFISVLVSRLPADQAERARKIGLGLALLFRILLLMTITTIIKMKEPVFSIWEQHFSWRDLILLGGGFFLLFKATHEIHKNIEEGDAPKDSKVLAGFSAVILQIVLIDLVFSIDSIVTAIGIVEHVQVMIAAVIISMIVMYFASVAISTFIQRHPTTKVLALSFLFLIGAALIADGLHFHIPRGYIYFSIAFAMAVETINILIRKNKKKSS